MSECVVRMELPAQCASCPMWRMDFFKGKMLDLCRVNGKYMDTPYGERPDWCPIVCQLPEGHGRLVDGDMPISEIEKYITIWDCNCSEYGNQTVMAVDDLKYLPTIVPADTAERSE